MTVAQAWEVFGDKNGDPTFERFQGRLARFRDRIGDPGDSVLSCLVLRDAVFLTEPDWLPWDDRQGWAKNTVAYKKYDLATGPGIALEKLLLYAHPCSGAGLR